MASKGRQWLTASRVYCRSIGHEAGLDG